MSPRSEAHEDDPTRQTRVAYDQVAGSYAKALPDTRYEAALDLEMVNSFIDSIEYLDVLDAGCGTGRMMTYLRERTPELRLSGLDLSTAMVELARSANPSAQVVEGDIAAMPFHDAQFGGVLAWYSIIHSAPTELPKVFSEICRILRSRGKVLMAFQSGTGTRQIANAYGHDVELKAFLHSASALVPVLRAAGLEVDTVLDRAPRDSEKSPQCFILATRI